MKVAPNHQKRRLKPMEFWRRQTLEWIDTPTISTTSRPSKLKKEKPSGSFSRTLTWRQVDWKWKWIISLLLKGTGRHLQPSILMIGVLAGRLLLKNSSAKLIQCMFSSTLTAVLDGLDGDLFGVSNFFLVFSSPINWNIFQKLLTVRARGRCQSLGFWSHPITPKVIPTPTTLPRRSTLLRARPSKSASHTSTPNESMTTLRSRTAMGPVSHPGSLEAAGEDRSTSWRRRTKPLWNSTRTETHSRMAGDWSGLNVSWTFDNFKIG